VTALGFAPAPSLNNPSRARAGGGRGTATRLPSGRWQARYRDAAGKRYSHSFTTRAAAVRWKAAGEAAVRRGTHTEPPVVIDEPAPCLPPLARVPGSRTRRVKKVSGDWYQAIEAHIVHVRAGGGSSGSVRLRRHCLYDLADQVAPAGPWDVKPAQLAGFLSRQDWSPETRKSARTTLRRFYAWAEDAEHVELSPARKLPTVRIPAGRPRPTPDRVLAEALAAADPRQRLMLLLAAHAGLRRAEVAQVHTRDLVERELRVTGKGGVVRVVPIGGELADLLEAAPAGFLFPGRVDGHVSPGYVGFLLKRLLGDEWSGHTLRHRFASRAYAGTRDLRAVQELLGHSKPETTMRYTAIPDGALRAAAAAAYE